MKLGVQELSTNGSHLWQSVLLFVSVQRYGIPKCTGLSEITFPIVEIAPLFDKAC